MSDAIRLFNQMDVAKQTSNGLDELKDRLRTAETAKETADLNARATLEIAQLVNRANQMQALRDAQNAERELAIAEDIKKVNEDNARALREGLKGLTWRKKQ